MNDKKIFQRLQELTSKKRTKEEEKEFLKLYNYYYVERKLKPNNN